MKKKIIVTRFDISSTKRYIVTTYEVVYTFGRIFSKGMIEQKKFYYPDERDSYVNNLIKQGYKKI